MKNFNWYIGIDISKNTLDLCLFDGQNIYKETRIGNTAKCLLKEMKQWQKEFNLVFEEVLVCAEYTGRYIYPLLESYQSMGMQLWLESGAQIKQSWGLQRGKSDKVDARRIAQYSWRHQDKMRLVGLKDEELITLKDLLAECRGYVEDRAKYKGQLKDDKGFMSKQSYRAKKARLETLIKALTKQISTLEQQMKEIVDKHDTLKNQRDLLVSVTGVGPKLALETIAATEGFTKFTNARQMMCYVGVAPFRYTSGTSTRSKARISHRANKKLKSLLHMAALSVIRLEGEFKDYYERKVAEGKAAMQVLNAIRGKIVLRMFAVIKNNCPYQKNYKNELQMS
jgi:transposase